ncbi:MAG: tRNA (guanine(46)-N(7))-methyltransferase TrmB [Amaricoccus sp.]|uniref:tRNA (guanine(46)-N(7))-methyltransferase TrmB n=1 Tax=Amaricoccus sp. TaxID=1872485 RepID=UPI0039E3E1B4
MTDADLQGRDRPWRNLYGRRRGKRLKPNQARLLETLLPRLAVRGVSPVDNPDRVPFAPLFPDGRPLWLEVGFGGGEHMVAQAEAHPGVGLIGCEPFVNGVAMALNHIDGAGVENIRLHAGDARDLIELLPEGGLARVFLLYPDPWPKARHVRRRFMSLENLALLARAMAPGAELRVATDIADYADHARAMAAEAPGFARVGRDEAAPWDGWPGTRYEAKALAAGRVPQYMSFERVD